MWSHYAASHTGFCLEFDTAFDPFSQAKKVCYKEEVGELSLSSIKNEDEEFQRVMFLTKAKCWLYENEWRIIHQKGDILQKYPAESLKAIYLGTAMNPECKDLIKRILRGHPTRICELEKRDSFFWFHVRCSESDPKPNDS